MTFKRLVICIMPVYTTHHSLSETYGQSRIRLLTMGKLIEIFLFTLKFHALFRLAHSHFHIGNLTNPVKRLYT